MIDWAARDLDWESVGVNEAVFMINDNRTRFYFWIWRFVWVNHGLPWEMMYLYISAFFLVKTVP